MKTVYHYILYLFYCLGLYKYYTRLDLWFHFYRLRRKEGIPNESIKSEQND